MYVPTMAMRTGDFSGLINSAGVLQQLYDPNTTQSAANNYARTPFPKQPDSDFRASARWRKRSLPLRRSRPRRTIRWSTSI